MCCGCNLAGAGGAEGLGGVGMAVEVDGPVGSCMLVPWLLVCVRQVPMAAAVSGRLSAVLRAT